MTSQPQQHPREGSRRSRRRQVGRAGAPRPGERLVRYLAPASAPVVDVEARTVELSFSSETPVERWFGLEVLSHAPGAADLTRLNAGAPLLFNHEQDDVLGVVESAQIARDGRGRAVVRLGRDERGEWALQQIADGILGNTSFAYIVNKYEEGDGDTFTATRWAALEISIVTVPADPSVGVGRSLTSKENTIMDRDDITTAGEGLPSLGRRARQHQRDYAEQERERVLAVNAICRKYKMDPEKFISDGSTIEDVRSAALDELDRRSGRQRPIGTTFDREEGALIGLDDTEVRKFSLVRAINAFISNDWSRAGFERECSRTVAQQTGRQTQGFFIPMEVLQRGQWDTRAAYQVGVAGQGGNLVATNLQADQFVQALRNTSRVIEAGAMMLTGLVGNVDVPRQNSATATYWVAESSAITEAEATFDKISLRPKTVGALSKISRNMLLQSTPNIEMMVRADLMAVMGLAIDLAALSGPGTGNQPTGVLNTSGIGSVIMGTNGAAITLDSLVALETALANSNAPLDTRAYLLNTKTIGTLKNLKATTGAYLWTNSTPGQRSGTPPQFNGYNVLQTNQLRSTLTKGTSTGVCSELVFGAWSELVIGQWGGLEILLNPFDATGFTTGDVLIRAMQTVDIGVRHPVSFAGISDALTP